MRSIRVILDTNLWISFLISKKLEHIDNYILEGRIKLIFSKELIEEFLSVAKKPKFERYFTGERISELLSLFDRYGKLVEVTTNRDECRDKKDNFLLNLAIDGKMDYLVTGDDDLLVLGKISKTKILSWADFISELE
jgi:hypothetical protein